MQARERIKRYLIQSSDEAGIVLESAEDERVILFMDLKERLDKEFRVLREQKKLASKIGQKTR